LIDDGVGGDFQVSLDTVGLNADTDSHLVSGLTTGLTYRVKLVAFNFNTE